MGYFVAYFSSFFFSLHQMTPLHVAAEEGRYKIMGYLVGKGADINVKDDNKVSQTTLVYGTVIQECY